MMGPPDENGAFVAAGAIVGVVGGGLACDELREPMPGLAAPLISPGGMSEISLSI
jgi:hypothetical protein